MPNTFDEATHTYRIDDIVVPSVTEICSILTADKYASGSGAVEGARARGTAVHELCEAYDYGVLDEAPEELAGYVQAWGAFCRDYQPTWLYIERPMWSRVWGMAGTCDRVGVIDGVTCLVDIKTTSSMDKTSKLALLAQLYGYHVLLFNDDITTNISKAMGVQLKRDGTYTVHVVKNIEKKYGVRGSDLFMSCVTIYEAKNGRISWSKI